MTLPQINRWSRRVWLAGALSLYFLLADHGFALDPSRDILEYNCQTWSRQNGLPANGINAITQTKDGYLWLGTAVGLVRFDGIEFKLLDLANVPQIRNTIVTSLASAKDGGLWVGLENNAFGFYDGQSFSFRGKAAYGKVNMNVRTILEGKDGTIWLAAERMAARLTRSGSYEEVLGSSSNYTFNVTCGYEDSKGRLWFGTANAGVYYWQAGKITKLPGPILDETVDCVVEDLKGQIWIGTGAQLYCYDSNLQRKEIPPLTTEIHALLVDRHGVLWIGTTGYGLVRYQDGQYSYFRKTDGLTSDYVNSLAEDREGSLWIGTRDGLSQLTDVKFPTHQAAEDPTVKDVLAVSASHTGGVWMGSSAGLTYFDGNKPKTYGLESGLTNHYIKRVFEARNGDVYLVSGARTLVVFSGEKVVASYLAPSLVVGLAEDAHGVVASVGPDLYRVGTNYFTPYIFTNDQPTLAWVLNLASGHDGEIWVACGAGIFRVKDGAFKQWSAEAPISSVVQWVCEDSDGIVWGAQLTGIVRLKDNQLRYISRKDGLFDNNIFSIVPDDFGNLWVDSGRGIFRVSRKNMNDFADGKTNHVECVAYDGPESVKPSDKTTQEHVACKTLDGRIWFPSANGVVEIDPAHIPVNQIAPPVDIEDIRANGIEFDADKDVSVPPGHGELEFHFTALSFIAPHKIQFRYQLEGYDKGWVDAGDRRLAFYTNLKPGRYTFRVIAANADGVWNETGDALKIELQPFYYQTVWFRLLCGGLALAVLVGLYLQRVRHLKLKQRVLQKNRDLLEAEVLNRTRELADSKALYHSLVEQLPTGVFRKDKDGRYVFANASFCQTLGLTVDQITGRLPSELMTQTAARQHSPNAVKLGSQGMSHHKTIMATGRQIEVEDVYFDAKGRPRHYHTVKSAVFGSEGQIIGTQGILFDITESKSAAEALRESEALYLSLVDQMPAGVFRKDAEGRYVFVNSWFCQIKGMKPDQILGKTPKELAASELAGQNAKYLETVKETRLAVQGLNHHELIMKTGERIEVEEEYPGADGKMLHLHVVKSPVFDSDGRIIGTQGMLFDVSGRRQAEAELSHERDLLRALLDNSLDHIYFKDTQSRFIKSSKSQAMQFDADSSDKLVGKTDFDFFTEEHARPAFEDEQEIIRTGQPMIGKVEKEILKNGRESWALTSKMPLRNKDGQIIGTFGISKDITDIKEAENMLRESEERFYGAFEYAPIGVALVSPDGHWLKVNREVCNLVGYSEAELLTRTFQDMTHPDDLAADLENVRRLLAGEIRSYQMEKRYIHVSGHFVTVLLNVSLVRDGRGRPRYFISQIQDITERKRLEAQLFQSQKMETVGKLAGGIAHEFNSILTAIIGQSELLLDDLPAGSPLAKNATEISKAADRAATLTRQLLAYGRRQFLQPEILDLNRVIASMDGMFYHLMGGAVDMQIIPARGLRAVKVDAGQIEQVIMNMVINARDAMPNGGKLTLETTNVSFDQESAGHYPDLKPGEYVMLAITDTGAGMSEAVKARLFEPFFTTKDVGQGTGLGLSTCYGIVKQSGGHISVYSEPGRGTTFKIYLPQVEHQPKIPVQRLEPPDLPRGTETILLVEDDPSLREMASSLLERLGYTVLAAANGIEALSLKQQRDTGHIDLLFTDVVMPHMSGKELADRVRALYPHTKILFTSAYSGNAIVHQGVLDKGVALLQKPFTPSALAHKVRVVLDQPPAPKPDAA
ncbi:MAG TPA: PAS domain S-box protein [Verrucomicrobiae bacterium]|jgi:PAS domain S-box-containing protein